MSEGREGVKMGETFFHYRITTFSGKPENLEKSGNSKMVRKMSGTMQKVKEKLGILFLSGKSVRSGKICRNTTFITCL